MTGIREQIRAKIFEASVSFESEWLKNTVITANGTHIFIADSAELNTKTNATISEIFELVGGDEELREFMIAELSMHAKAGDYSKRREEALGWKPGMTVGTPDVPQEIVDEYIGVEFHCEHCG